MIPYPKELPVEALPIVIAALRGNLPKQAVAVHAAYEVAGYILGQIDPDAAPSQAMAGACQITTNAEAADVLESLLPGKEKAIPWGSINWQNVLTFVMTLISLFAKPAPTPAS